MESHYLPKVFNSLSCSRAFGGVGAVGGIGGVVAEIALCRFLLRPQARETDIPPQPLTAFWCFLSPTSPLLFSWYPPLPAPPPHFKFLQGTGPSHLAAF